MSMPREEALDIIENKIQIDVRFCTKEEVEQYQEALTMALTALRPVSQEHVERMAGEWVQDINKGPAVFYCSSCGESFEIHSYEFQKYRFCPFCMAPMTDEAGDILLKRLEALKDGL